MKGTVWLAPAAALVLAALATYALWQPGAPFSAVDVPNERSLHVRPTPRTGGLAIVGAVALSWSGLALTTGLPSMHGYIALAGAMVAGISLADDRTDIRARYRFAVHVAAAATLVVGGLGLAHVQLPGVALPLGGVASAVVTTLFVVWMTNLYNFMDGMDGFAGGMAVSGFGFLAFAFGSNDEPVSASATAVVAAAALGFLRYNFPPARIFLGDVGSAPLGFMSAGFMLLADHSGAAPLYASMLAFSPFIVDATVTLAWRALRGEKVWQAHRSHFYQRLVLLGWGHRRTVLCEYGVMGVSLTGALAVRTTPPAVGWSILSGVAVAYGVAMAVVARLDRGAR